tara:strand:+ start:399 stop:608 length:210 start_codon:yes stop_codon:yes gene_type:complete
VGTTSSKAVCGQSIGSTYYHDGSGTAPVVGDNCYSDSGGTTSLSNGYYKTTALGGIRIISGAVNNTFLC